MIRHLLALRYRSMMAGFRATASKKGKSGKGMMILLTFLLLYGVVAACALMYLLFDSLAMPYHMLGLDWLYFAMAGTIALGFSLLGSVFSTQSQLYDAKDNGLLLSMPIPPKWILLSRIIPLLTINFLITGVVMIPAIVVYAIQIACSPAEICLQFVSILLICILVQALACLLGWLLHLLLQKMSKSLGSLLFMVAFLCIYFGVYSQASGILQSMAANGEKIADTLETWVWPLYAMGMGCTGSPLLLAFFGIASGAFLLVYRILSATFLKTATATAKHVRRRITKKHNVRTPKTAVAHKELQKFLNTPVYLTNMGLGLIMVAALPIAALIFRSDLLSLLAILETAWSWLPSLVPVLICAVISFVAGTACISTPSVSLEGKNIWILKSMPIDAKDILLGKLRLHILATVPLATLCGLALGIIFGCGLWELLLIALVSGLLFSFSGSAGLVVGLKWAKLDYLSEAYPCKQSVSVLIISFGMMGLPILLGLGYYFLFELISPMVFLGFCTFILGALTYVFTRCLLTWGVRKWEQL